MARPLRIEYPGVYYHVLNRSAVLRTPGIRVAMASADATVGALLARIAVVVSDKKSTA